MIGLIICVFGNKISRVVNSKSYFIIRNNHRFDPYTIQVLKQDGKILRSDKAYDSALPTRIITVRNIFKQERTKVKIKHSGSLFKQINNVGKSLIIPEKHVLKKRNFSG